MKYKRQLVSGMLAISLLASGTTAFAAETSVRPSKIPTHLNQVKMKSDTTSENKEAEGKKTRAKKGSEKSKAAKKTKKPENKNKIKATSTTTTPII